MKCWLAGVTPCWKRKVAIKRILGDAAKSRTAVSRFRRKPSRSRRWNHPNIVQIYDYGQAADGPFLIMEHAAGAPRLITVSQNDINASVR